MPNRHELELPALRIDDVSTPSATGLVVINRFPAPGETDVSIRSTIEFDVYDIGGTALAADEISVSLDGSTVVVVSATVIPNGGLHVEVTADDFGSEQEITVHATVRSQTFTWQFTTEDVTRPHIVSAIATGPNRIRVVFSEPMGPSAAISSNYVIQRLSFPAVNLTVSEVSFAPEETLAQVAVDLTTDIEMTIGASYQVAVQGASILTGIGPFSLSENASLILRLDGTARTVTFRAINTDGRLVIPSIERVTATDAASEIARQIPGIIAVATPDGRIHVSSSDAVIGSVEAVGGTALEALGLSINDPVADIAGNPVTSAVVAFGGFVPASTIGRVFQLWQHISPLHKDTDDGSLENFVGIVQEATDMLLASIDRWTDILDPDIAPERYLDLILRDLGNPFTDFHLSVVDKRRLANLLVQIYKQKGTGPGIKNVIRFFLGIDVEITTLADDDALWVLGHSALGTSGPTSASLTAATRAPYGFTAGDTLAVYEGQYGFQTIVFGAATSTTSEPFDLTSKVSNGQVSFTLQVDSDGPQTIVVDANEFQAIYAVTAQEIANVFNSYAAGSVEAVPLVNGRVRVMSLTHTALSGVEVTGAITCPDSHISAPLTAQQTADIMAAQLAGMANDVVEVVGEIENSVAGPYATTAGMTLEVELNGTPRIIEFTGPVTALQLAQALTQGLFGCIGYVTADGRVGVKAGNDGDTIQVVGGAANDIFGFPTVLGSMKTVRMTTAQVGNTSYLQIPDQSGLERQANDVLNFPVGYVEGADRGTDLWPAGSMSAYSFNIVSPVELTPEQRNRIRNVVDYMKPAHTHFVQLIEPSGADVINHAAIGYSSLGVNWILHESEI